MDTLNGRIALITGASRGIGRAVAIALAREGADVAVNFREQEQEARITLDLIAPTHRRAIRVQADVSKKADVNRLAETVEKQLGPIDILVNNAGVARRIAMEDLTEADWDETMAINLKSVFLVTQAVLPGMRSRRWGRIINISSGATRTGGAVGIHYTASKGGMNALTRAYAARLVKEGITVNAVAPVLIQTAMQDPEKGKNVPLGRLGRPEEVAEVVRMLAGNEFMTGQVLHLSGGLYFT